MTDKQKPITTALQTVAQFEEAFPDGKFNRLLPSTLVESVQKFSKLTIELVKIDPDPKNQEVFSLGSYKDDAGNWQKKLAFTKTALDKIAFTMGMQWVSEKCRRVDPRDNRDYFEFQVVAMVTKPDGQKLELSATKGVHVQDAVEETRNKLSEQLEDGKLYKYVNSKAIKLLPGDDADRFIERKCKAREIHVRAHGLALAESGARNRLVRAMNIKPHYTEAELGLPFVVPRIDINVEEVHADPAQRIKTLDQATISASTIFGPEPEVNNLDIPEENIVDGDFEAVDPGEEAGYPTAREEFETTSREQTSSERHGRMLTMIKEQDIRSPKNPEEQMRISFATWDKRSDDDQIKNLLWAYDLRYEESEDKEETYDDLPV